MGEEWNNSITFYVNGQLKKVSSTMDPRTTLLCYLRDHIGLTGTKLGCGEGGCGACTVMLSHYDGSNVRHVSANACLTPLCGIDGYAVTTVEGIGGMRAGLHPVQQRISSMHGSQCGFCTPGIVMALYAFLRAEPNATPAQIEDAMDGNLCRCTGYRPIIDAAKSLSNNKPAGGGCCGGGGGKGGCPCKEGGAHPDIDGARISANCTGTALDMPGLNEAMAAQGITEPIFPPALMRYAHKPVRLTYRLDEEDRKKDIAWFQPVTLAALHALKQQYKGDARLIVGNTEVGIETRFKYFEYSTFINPSHVGELNVLTREEGGIRVGGNVTINSLRQFILEVQQSSNSSTVKGLAAIRDMLSWFASNQIRNVACVAGNIVTASPISDLNPMLLACKAVMRVSSGGSSREVPADQFYLSYRKVNLAPEEVFESVFIPYTSEFEFVVPLKQARRREDDISIVTAGMRFVLAPDGGRWVVRDCSLSFGGMSPISMNAVKTQACLVGKAWSAATVEGAYDTLKAEMLLPEGVPGGQAEYRMALAASFLFRSFIQISLDMQKLLDGASGGMPAIEAIDERERSAAENFLTGDKPHTSGAQSYAITPQRGPDSGIQTADEANVHAPAAPEHSERTPVGDSLMHKSAPLQVSGEALYTDDINAPTNTAHAALVTSTKAHAKIISVDLSVAEQCPGFIRYFCQKDITGSNAIGAIVKDEEVFASDTVKYYGAVIGVVIAETHEQAMHAARKVEVTYDELTPVVSIEEAIAAQSFYPTVHEIKRGDVEAVAASAAADPDLVVVEGEGRIGSQEHFYLETNCTLVIPKESGQLEVFSSTQNTSKTQMFCAHVCGIPANNVVCRVKRMGGGFGGKETRSVFIAVTAALAAHLTGRPVKINIERDLDMQITGQRHAYYYKYKVGCSRSTGKLAFMDAELYNNAGYSMDLSQPVMDRALFHSDNAYFWPAQRVKGIVCRTNQPSHTAYRGFGGPQGMFLADLAMNHLAETIKMPVLAFKELNLYKNGDTTHYGQVVEEYNVPAMVARVKQVAEVARREEDIKVFNAANRWKKRGISLDISKFGINFTAKFYNQGGALVLIYTDGTVLVSHGGTEMGQGLHTKMVQVAAQAFGISHSLVHVEESQTNCVPNASPTAASMSTDLYGMAVLNACEQIRDRLKPVRAKLPADATWQQLVFAAYFDRVNLSAQGFYAVPSARTGYDWDIQTENNADRGCPFNYFTQGVACTEVEIDCLTGDSRVLRADVLMDVGRSINPAIDIGQIEGAYVQGFGYCTMEEMIWGDSQHKWVRPGQLFSRGPGTYKIPAFNDVPMDMRVHLTDTDNRFAVHSSKAVGEPPFYLGVSAFFAIRKAVQAARAEFKTSVESNDALNSDSFEYVNLFAPITSERIRTACRDPLVLRCVGGDDKYQAKGSW